MIKFRMFAPNGNKLYGLGLTDENVKRIQGGEPVIVNLEEIGGEGSVMIFYGESTQELLDQVQALNNDLESKKDGN